MTGYRQGELFSVEGHPSPEPVFPPSDSPPSKADRSSKQVVKALGLITASSLLSTFLVLQVVNGSDRDANMGVAPSSNTAISQQASDSLFFDNWGPVAAQAKASVVTIRVSNSSGGGEGTGVILNEDGMILSNNHVVAPALEDGGAISVILSDGRIFDASVVGTDASTDLGVIKLDNPLPADDAGFVPAKFSSAPVMIGQSVMAVGNPLGLSDTVTTGIVSALNRPVVTGGMNDEATITNAIQTDAAINPGNSGGPLMNSNGEVIGINSSIATASQTSGSIGLGFAIPGSEAQRVSKEIIETGTVSHALLGVSLDDAGATVGQTTRQAAEVQEVTPDGAADEGGVEVGDLITAVDGLPTPGSDALTAFIRSYSPDQKIVLSVVRDGISQDIDVTLGSLENS